MEDIKNASNSIRNNTSNAIISGFPCGCPQFWQNRLEGLISFPQSLHVLYCDSGLFSAFSFIISSCSSEPTLPLLECFKTNRISLTSTHLCTSATRNGPFSTPGSKGKQSTIVEESCPWPLFKAEAVIRQAPQGLNNSHNFSGLYNFPE